MGRNTVTVLTSRQSPEMEQRCVCVEGKKKFIWRTETDGEEKKKKLGNRLRVRGTQKTHSSNKSRERSSNVFLGECVKREGDK